MEKNMETTTIGLYYRAQDEGFGFGIQGFGFFNPPSPDETLIKPLHNSYRPLSLKPETFNQQGPNL